MRMEETKIYTIFWFKAVSQETFGNLGIDNIKKNNKEICRE